MTKGGGEDSHELLFELLLDGEGTMLLACDGAGMVTTVRGGSAEAIGLAATDVGKPVRDVLVDCPELATAAARALQGRASRSFGRFGGRSFVWLCVPREAGLGGMVALGLESEDLGLERAGRELPGDDALVQLVRSEALFRDVFEQSDVGMAIWSPEGRLERANLALCQILGYPEEQLVGLHYKRFSLDQPDEERRFERVLKGVLAAYTRVKRIRRGSGGTTIVSVHVSPRIVEGEVVQILAVIRDIREQVEREEVLRQTLAEHETLLQEVHHRVKNNLQVVSSLLSLQRLGSDDPEVRAQLADGESRVAAMALVHEMLYSSPTLSTVDARKYAARLVGGLIASVGASGSTPMLQVRGEDYAVSADEAVPFGLVLVELVSNAIKHAFDEGDPGRISVELWRNEAGRRCLGVHDDGRGFDLDAVRGGTLGMRILDRLAEQLHGELRYSVDEGTRAMLCLGGDQEPVRGG